MLREGYKEEDIAKAFTDKLNSAIQAVESETAYQDLASAWNNAVDAYCRANKIPGAKEYHLKVDDVPAILQSYVELDNFINNSMNNLNETKDVIKNFFKQIGI